MQKKIEILVQMSRKIPKFRRKIENLTVKISKIKYNVSEIFFSVNLRNSLYFIGRKNEILAHVGEKSGECNESNDESTQLMTHPTY